MQFYDVISKKYLNVGGIDKSLNYIRLRWQRTEGKLGKSTSGKQYVLSSADKIWGMVHVFPADMKIKNLFMSVNRLEKYDLLRCNNDGWYSKIYYVNIFYQRKSVEYENRQ